MTVAVSAAEPSAQVLAELLARELAGRARVEMPAAAARVGPVLGFVAGLKAAGRARAALAAARRELRALRPDVAVLVAFPGLHLPLGRWCRRQGTRVVQLGPPQSWAWGGFRAGRLRRSADRVVCLFDFEERPLRSAGVDARYYGYPLLDAVRAEEPRERTLARLGFGPGERYVAFMPGSRPAEREFHVPLFEQVAGRLDRELPGLRAAMVARPPAGQRGRVAWSAAGRYDILAHAECAVVCSGTATAEAAILGRPMVVTYHLPGPDRLLARLLVRSRFFSLPNLLAGEAVVPELLEPTVDSVVGSLRPLLGPGPARAAAMAGLGRAAARLGPRGAIAEVARLVLDAGRGPDS